MLIDLLINSFGKPKKFYPNIKTLEFNCPKCAEDEGINSDGKYNLAVSLIANKHVFKCWKCEIKGKVEYLLKRYGTDSDYKKYIDYNLIDISGTTEKTKNNFVSLPREFIPFSKMDKNNPEHVKAFNYITKNRCVPVKTLYYLNIGFCVDGYYKERLIFPSYNKKNNINFLITRTYNDSVKPNYIKCGVEQNEIILNEYNINWNHPVYLVEGYLDLTTIPFNTIPLGGKEINNVLLDKILDNDTPVILILDPDAKNNAIDIEEQLKLFNINYVKNIILKETEIINNKLIELDLNEVQKYKGSETIKKYLKCL